jgi:hypothetical protein
MSKISVLRQALLDLLQDHVAILKKGVATWRTRVA